MKRTRHTPEQIVKKLHEAATLLAGGKSIEEVCKGLAISPATYHRWEKEYGGADVNTVRENKALREENVRLNELSRLEPRAGYRTAAKHLRREGWKITDKRVQRLWREEGLKVRQSKEESRLGTSENGSQRQRASAPNEVWSYDSVMDRTGDGRRLKF